MHDVSFCDVARSHRLRGRGQVKASSKPNECVGRVLGLCHPSGTEHWENEGFHSWLLFQLCPNDMAPHQTSKYCTSPTGYATDWCDILKSHGLSTSVSPLPVCWILRSSIVVGTPLLYCTYILHATNVTERWAWLYIIHLALKFNTKDGLIVVLHWCVCARLHTTLFLSYCSFLLISSSLPSRHAVRRSHPPPCCHVVKSFRQLDSTNLSISCWLMFWQE